VDAVILAGGLGSRLEPFTKIIPKPLLPVGESSVLEIQIMSLKQFGFNKIYIATNYKSEYVEAFLGNGKKYGVELAFSKEDQPLGTCGPLKLLEGKIKTPFVMMNGDILTTLNFRELYKKGLEIDADLTVVTTEFITPFNFGRVHSEHGLITGVEEKPNFKFDILAGIYFFKPEIFKYIPSDRYFGIDSLIINMLSVNSAVGCYKTSDYWLDIGRANDYEKAQLDYGKFFGNLAAGGQ